MSDQMVLKTQQWLNNTYRGKTGYTVIPENGNTGWTTIYALLHALQIELGITATANNFGPSTIAKFNERFPNGIIQQDYPSEYEDNIYGIIQGALWCKGYSTGASTITRHFYDGTGNGIKSMKMSAGCSDTSSTVTLNVMKALMSMTQFEKVDGGNDKIRIAQQEMNRNYEAYIGLSPCDGLYSRDMNKAMIKVLQAIEGYSVEDATGNFGDGTKKNLPIIPSNGKIDFNRERRATKLVRYALLCNGYEVEIDSEEWDSNLSLAINEFQRDMCINQVNSCNVDTWMALLLSKGNPDRSCVACDTRFEITDNRLKYIKDNGYKIIGRYLTGGTFKELRKEEPQRIISNDLLLFCIFQESSTDLSYFTEEKGKIDAKNSVKAARKLGIPGSNVIYFAVDTDPTDAEIQTYILPYFKAISENIDKSYIVGVYGTRNVCTKVMKYSYAQSCFVSDMSTGFSGNMGFKMPKNWGLDQFHEIKNIYIDGENENMDLDKVAYSGKLCTINDIDITPVDEIYPNIIDFAKNIKDLEECYKEYCNNYRLSITSREIAIGVLDFIRSFRYNKGYFKLTLGECDNNFISYIENNYSDLYNEVQKYARDNRALVDLDCGFIDIGHLACTLQAYLKDIIIIKPYWLGWAGDLSSLMSEVDEEIKNNPNNVTHLSIAESLIGKKSNFGYIDICTDADAIGLCNIINSYNDENSKVGENFLYNAILDYYNLDSDGYKNRYNNFALDIGCDMTEDSLATSIVLVMNIGLENFIINMITGTMPSVSSQTACITAFINYILNN